MREAPEVEVKNWIDIRRGKRGRFKESDDQGRSLAADRRKKAKNRW